MTYRACPRAGHVGAGVVTSGGSGITARARMTRVEGVEMAMALEIGRGVEEGGWR
jgi:hypothetical protein